MTKHWSADPTGNIAIDTITAGMSHYRKFGRTTTMIILDYLWWFMFKEWLKEFAPDVICDDEVIFKGCTFKRGTKLTTTRIQFFTKVKGTSLDNGQI